MTALENPKGERRELPSPFNSSAESFELITQGAEALVYKTPFLTPDNFTALKIRPVKAWRHPMLDKRLTRQRILAEARVLNKCRKEGVPVPAVSGMDWEKGWIASEWIEGKTVKEAIRNRDKSDEAGLKELLQHVGLAVGKLHGVGVIHGDLTTSNMMLRPAADGSGLSGEIVLIDFGLSTQAVQEEDRAVDLYVLERAFGSTHPKEEAIFDAVLTAYATTFKGAKSTLRRLEDVRMRGRKKNFWRLEYGIRQFKYVAIAVATTALHENLAGNNILAAGKQTNDIEAARTAMVPTWLGDYMLALLTAGGKVFESIGGHELPKARR